MTAGILTPWIQRTVPAALVAVSMVSTDVWADPIQIQAASAVSVSESIDFLTANGQLVGLVESRAVIRGDGTLSKSITAGDMIASVTSRVSTAFSPATFASHGGVEGSIVPGSSPALSGLVQGSSTSGFLLTLAEPAAYIYSLQAVLGGRGNRGDAFLFDLTEAMRVGDGNGTPIFDDTFFNGEGRLVREHSGILQPGVYRGGGLFNVELRSIDGAAAAASAAFHFAFSFGPVVPAPTPEPMTLALFGTGVVGMATRAWRRRDRR